MRWDEIKREEKERKERKEKNGWWMEVHEKDFHSRDCFIWLSTRKEQFMDGSSVNAMKYCGEHSTEWMSENEGEEEEVEARQVGLFPHAMMPDALDRISRCVMRVNWLTINN